MSIARQRKAQTAYASRDTELSRAVHQSTELAEIAAGKSDFLHGVPPSTAFTSSPTSAFLLGSVSACIVGSTLSNPTYWFISVTLLTIILYLSAWIDERLQIDFAEFEKSRERWEVENFPEGEIQEMLQIYANYGISQQDALTVASTLAKYPDFWIDHMLLHEIGILPPVIGRTDDENEFKARTKSLGSFIASFILPTLLIVIGLSNLIIMILSHVQLVIILHLKSNQYQWLSKSTCVSILSATIVSSVTVSLLARLILSLV
jgi:DNA damage-binding protein 1